MAVKYAETTSSYNERRYGKPWHAKLSNSISRNFEFLDWDGRPGREGVFRFEAEPGTMLAYGQKDVRNGKGGVDGYLICMPDGMCKPVSDKTCLKLIAMPVHERVHECAKAKTKLFGEKVEELKKQFEGMGEGELGRAVVEKDLATYVAHLNYYSQFCGVVSAEAEIANQ